jgi:hypothetical protein
MLVEKAKNILAPRKPVEAALSHTSPQHVKEFPASDRPAFDHGGHHRQVRQHGRPDQDAFVKQHAVQDHLHVLTAWFVEINLRWLKRVIWRR